MKKYKFIARSPSDPNAEKGGLGFDSESAAVNHANRMNDFIKEYETNNLWNKEFWKSKPKSWEVYETT